MNSADSIRLSLWASKNEIFVQGQQNHLLQLLINSLLNRVMSFFNLNIIIKPLQILGALFGAFGVTVFYLFLYDIFKNRIAALMGCLGLAFSREYWHYSTIVETHIMPTALLISALYQTNKLQITDNVSKEVIKAAILFVTAVYCSEVYIFFIFSPLVFILFSNMTASRKRTAVLIFLLTVIICWVIPFGIIGHFIKQPFISMYGWFRGTAKITEFKFVNVSKLISNAFWKTIFVPGIHNMHNLITGSLLSLFILFGVFDSKGFVASVKNYYKLFIFCFISITLPSAIQLIYEPWNTERYTAFLIFIWIILSTCALGYTKAKSKVIKFIPIFLCVLVFIQNLFAFAIPEHNKENNRFLEASLFLARSVKQEDIICVVGHRNLLTPSVYIEYYTGIKPKCFLKFGAAKEFLDKHKLNAKQKFFFVLLRSRQNNQLWRILNRKLKIVFCNRHTIIYKYEIPPASEEKTN